MSVSRIVHQGGGTRSPRSPVSRTHNTSSPAPDSLARSDSVPRIYSRSPPEARTRTRHDTGRSPLGAARRRAPRPAAGPHSDSFATTAVSQASPSSYIDLQIVLDQRRASPRLYTYRQMSRLAAVVARPTDAGTGQTQRRTSGLNVADALAVIALLGCRNAH